jgi:hypothetical protein
MATIDKISFQVVVCPWIYWYLKAIEILSKVVKLNPKCSDMKAFHFGFKKGKERKRFIVYYWIALWA